MIDLVSIEQVKTRLRIEGTDHDYDLWMIISQASATVLRHIKADPIPDYWILNSSPITYDIPAELQGYTIAICAEMYENREAGVFNIQPILNLLSSWRPPTLA